jgi:hypothetical protein
MAERRHSLGWRPGCRGMSMPNGSARHEQLGHSRQCRGCEGSPTVAGNYTVLMTVTDANSVTASRRVPAARIGAAADQQQPAERSAGRRVHAAAARDRRGTGPYTATQAGRPDASRRYSHRRRARDTVGLLTARRPRAQLQPDRFVYRFGQSHPAHAGRVRASFLQHSTALSARRGGTSAFNQQRGTWGAVRWSAAGYSIHRSTRSCGRVDSCGRKTSGLPATGGGTLSSRAASSCAARRRSAGVYTVPRAGGCLEHPPSKLRRAGTSLFTFERDSLSTIPR